MSLLASLTTDASIADEKDSIGSGYALDDTAKQCYNAVDLTETNGLFLSSSPSVRPPEHCFVMPSRVADDAKSEHICNFQGSM